jgi:hypothetical protein
LKKVRSIGTTHFHPAAVASVKQGKAFAGGGVLFPCARNAHRELNAVSFNKVSPLVFKPFRKPSFHDD